MNGGQIRIYGESRVSWTKLGSNAAQGANQITLSSEIDWRVGDRVAIASSMLDSSEAEERAIKAVSGRSVTLETPLSHAHYGELQSFDAGKVSLDERAEVGLLSRNVVIQGDASSTSSQFGGHVMVMGASSTVVETNPAHRSSARVSGVEFRRMGQFNRLGRYPFHWHLNGPSSGDFIQNSAVHDSVQRGIVVHNTSDVMVKNNVVWNVPGHEYMIEAGGENNNTMEGNLAINPQPVSFTLPALAIQNDDKASGYWIKGKTNIFKGNTSAGGKFGGFWFDHPLGTTDKLLVFEGNTAHSHASSGGAGVWLQSGFDGAVNYSIMKFTGITAYKNGIGVWADEVTATADHSSFGDNRSAVSGNLNLTNAVVVGRSANTDSLYKGFAFDARWGGAGVSLYNNRSRLEDTTFINFGADQTAVHSVACRNESVRVRALRVRYVNAQTQFCGGDTLIDDADGSFSGTGKQTTVVSDEQMYTAQDVANKKCAPQSNGSVLCDGVVDYLYLFVQRDLSKAGKILITRDFDGKVQDSTYFPGFAITLPGYRFTLDTGLATLPTLNLYVGGANAFGPADPYAASVEVRVPSPNANFKVWRGAQQGCYTCGYNDSDASFRNAVLAPAVSLDTLRGEANGESYFYDATTKMIHLMMKREKPIFLERN